MGPVPAATTSAVAAALWYPYRALPEAEVTRWAGATFRAFATLAQRPGDRGRDAARPGPEPPPLPDPWWVAAVPRIDRVPAAELPAGYVDGYALTVPVVHMPGYLSWLSGELAAAGVPVLRRGLADLDPARRAADVVVHAAGLGARELVGDAAVTPVRGQVVRVADPGLRRWTLDEEHPAGMVYVVPRGQDVICGGIAEDGVEAGEPDQRTAAAILERCVAVVPELAGAEVLGHAVGARPVRPAVRLEREGDVVHCYGHGGSGVTLSWGCADEVARLVGSGHNAPMGSTRQGQPVLVVMGVSGCGKSTVAGIVAGQLGWELAEGDDLHPPENVAKMSAGTPLTDADRWPWLDRVGAWIRERTDAGRPGVITCSALKHSYRDRLRGDHVIFVHLDGSRELIGRRLSARTDHFMPAGLLDSQFAALEPLGPDEQRMVVSIGRAPAELAAEIVQRLGDADTG